MPSIRSFFRKAPDELCREFTTLHAAEMAENVDWSLTRPDLVKSLYAAFTATPISTQHQIQSDVERIASLSDEAGDAAMRSATDDHASLEDLPSNTARAVWLFVHDLTRFRHAEEIRYADDRRRGRQWIGFEGPADRPLDVSRESLDRLKAALREAFGWEKLHIDAFERSRIGSEEKEHRLLQLTIYREGWPEQDLAFEGDELVERSRRPVYEAAITYEPKSGSVEVVASDRVAREKLASLFCSEVLSVPFSNEKLRLRRYDLAVLATAYAFPVDAEDRIDGVRVAMLRLMPMETAEERLVLETLSKAKQTIWQMAENRLGTGNPLRGSWVITQARLTIQFHPEPGSGGSRTLPITISMPHGCDLKDRTSRERVVGQKYLRRWGLLQDVVA